MIHSPYDSRISNLEQQVSRLHNTMEGVSRKFVEEAAEFASVWILQKVEKTVVANPDQAKALGIEGLGALKSELRQLAEQAPVLTAEQLDKDEHWTHRSEAPNDSSRWMRYASYGRRSGRGPVDDGIREVLGNAGSLLIKHHFAQEGHDSEWQMTYDYGRAQSHHLIYGYNIEWSLPMLESLEQYSKLDRDLIQLEQQLKDLTREKAESEAKSLWEQV